MPESQIIQISFDKQMSLDECIDRGINLRATEDEVRWHLGDLADFVTRELGPKTINDFAIGIGKPKATIKRYRDVARAYPGELRHRYQKVPWSIFRALAAHPNRVDLLESAHDNNWTVEYIEVLLKESKTPSEPRAAKPEMEWCNHCKRWGLKFPLQDRLCNRNSDGVC